MGVGLGLIDIMTKPQINVETGEYLPDFGVYGGTQEDIVSDYKKYRTNKCEQDAIYVVKGTAPVNTEAHTILQGQMNSGKIKFLIDDRLAKNKLLNTKIG